MKYSDLARKVTLRLTTSGKKNESQNDRWLLARIAGRSSGMFSSPRPTGRHNARRNGPMKRNFASQ